MTRMTITERDAHTLLDLSDPHYRVESLEGVWKSLMAAVMSLVRCDLVTFQIEDVANQRMLAVRALTDQYEVFDDPDNADDEFYWSVFWSSQCSHPQRSGDYLTVNKPTDFESSRQLWNSATGDIMRQNGMRHEVMVPMPPARLTRLQGAAVAHRRA
jgi:hypothetical protein